MLKSSRIAQKVDNNILIAFNTTRNEQISFIKLGSFIAPNDKIKYHFTISCLRVPILILITWRINKPFLDSIVETV
ncbi:hypothetical protein BpHYR1_012777 [Brachionus plicatilis]|uniref:Uncharacterized protein n=1 Tax=Brachionus plicatilis TaxID=10195 RepID=A0A3M7SU00_BRAPC|nr:hypothetical protein BpHYR1_012777 [Brachionus plicatilis]